MYVESRTNSCRKTYYSLQGVGLGRSESSVDMVAYIWNTAVRPVLTYGLLCIGMSKKALGDL